MSKIWSLISTMASVRSLGRLPYRPKAEATIPFISFSIKLIHRFGFYGDKQINVQESLKFNYEKIYRSVLDFMKFIIFWKRTISVRVSRNLSFESSSFLY